ncbi:MAG: RloB family protein [Pseudobdellovibrionaceae bacterium]
MGSDDLHKKRRDRSNMDFSRKYAERKTYDNFLIVCEGETETFYLREVVDAFGINRKRAKVIPCPDGTDACSIINYADNIASCDLHDFDHVYCVFDGTGCGDLTKAYDLHKSINHSSFHLCISSPCFEFWVLCHYENSSKPYSNDAETCKSLQRYIKGYKKPMRGLFELTSDKLPDAISNARSVSKAVAITGSTNPSTNLYNLIEHLLRER